MRSLINALHDISQEPDVNTNASKCFDVAPVLMDTRRILYVFTSEILIAGNFNWISTKYARIGYRFVKNRLHVYRYIERNSLPHPFDFTFIQLYDFCLKKKKTK